MEDFDRLHEDELELMREMEDHTSDCPRSRRALQLSSPLLTPGSKKRPSENSPLPLLNLDCGSSPGGLATPPLSAPPKTHQSTPANPRSSSVNSHEGTSKRQALGAKSSQLSARRLLHDTRTVLHDVANTPPVPRPSAPSPPSNGYVRPPSPYSLGSTPSPPSFPDVSGVEEELSSQRERSEQGTPGLVSHTKRKVSDWLGRGEFPGPKGCGGDTSEGCDGWGEVEREGSMSPLERELREVEEYLHGTEPDRALPTTPLAGELTLQAEGSDLDHSQSRPKRPRMMGPYDDDDGGGEPMDTVAAASLAESRGVRGDDGGGRILTRAPAGPHISITGTDGTRVYLKMTTSAEEERKNKVWSSSHHLLPVKFTRLRQMVEEEKRRRLIEQSDQLLQSLQGDMGESEPLFESEEPVKTGEEEVVERSSGSILWVEKYSPKNYTELLSDDGINRTLLSWLKLWDEVVFGRKTVALVKTEKEKKVEEKRGKYGDKKVDVKDPSTLSGPEALDDSRRPQMKIALLCGAPGLGKTTLAHVIAQHAGYNVVEMNASDDRSPEMFRNNIEASTQMQAVLTSDSKPNCLIIDEIDGAPTAAVNVLIDLIKKKDGGGKKKKKDIVLLRPIVCICNDQYASSLRQLRQHALILYFPPTASARLATRLQQVAKREYMSAAISALMALCEKSENDIRSCLNTLQFIHKKQKELTLAAVQSVSVGQKDAQRSLFSLWKEVFQLSVGKRHTVNNGPHRLSGMEEVLGLNATTFGSTGDVGSGDERSLLSASASRFHQMLSATMATGEYEKVVQGLFENYLLMRFRDPNMRSITAGQEWFVFHDILQRHISQSQDYLFVRYQPFLPVAFHFLFSSLAKPQIKYPHSDFEAFQRQQQNQHLISSLMTELPPSIKQYTTPTILSVDLLSPFLEIISPIFRPVSIQLYSAREKQQLTDLVNTMISCGVTYRQEKGPDGQYTYILDPNIEQLCRFPGLPQKRQMSYSAKQMISREIELEKLRRAEKVQTMNEVNTIAPRSATTTTGSTNATIQPISRSPTAEIQTDEVVEKPAKLLTKLKDEKQPTDFFGRMVKSRYTSSGSSSAANSGSTHPLWFKFNEGYSNAVRRPVRIQDLL